MDPLNSLMFNVLKLIITYCDVLQLLIPLLSVLVLIQMMLESDVVNICIIINVVHVHNVFVNNIMYKMFSSLESNLFNKIILYFLNLHLFRYSWNLYQFYLCAYLHSNSNKWNYMYVCAYHVTVLFTYLHPVLLGRAFTYLHPVYYWGEP